MREIIRHLKRMPEALAVLSCGLFVSGGLLVILTVSPWNDWNDKHGPISYSELWKSGTGPVLAAAGIAMIAVAVSLYRAQRWVQTGIPLGFLTAAIIGFAFPQYGSAPEASFEWLGAGIWALISWWYLNRKRKVLDYFASCRR